MYEMFTPIHFI